MKDSPFTRKDKSGLLFQWELPEDLSLLSQPSYIRAPDLVRFFFQKTPPKKSAVIAAAAKVSDALGELIESLWRIGNLLASLG